MAHAATVNVDGSDTSGKVRKHETLRWHSSFAP